MIRKQIKAAAKQQIKGQIGMLFLISVIVSMISMVPVAGMILGPGLSMGMILVYLNMTYGKPPVVEDALNGARFLGKAWWLNFLISFFTALWSMLFYIPGIIASLRYSLAFYVLAENPHMTARQALNESKRLMQGHKMELFVMNLSFIGWYILCMFTFFIPIFYVTPYHNTSIANFYQYVKQVAPPVQTTAEQYAQY